MSKFTDNIDHKTVVLDKQAIKVRNEAQKDYTKMFDKAGIQRGPGRGVYLGSKAKDKKGKKSMSLAKKTKTLKAPKATGR